uniref:Uncharacterized protein n=1 Tax=Canis lupus dingo TaxID=286419 RepID=A0A8C0JWX0_CANLU
DLFWHGVCVPNAFAYLTNSQGLLIVTRAGPSVFLGFVVAAVVLTAGKAWPLDGNACVEGGQLPLFLRYSVPQMEW